MKKLAFLTPGGLKVRLDQEALTPILYPLRAYDKLKDIWIDLELWERMASTTSNLFAIIASISGLSWEYILLSGLIGYVVGETIFLSTYSDFLRALIPQLFGSWMTGVVVVVWMFIKVGITSFTSPTVALALVVGVNWLGLSSIFSIVMLPMQMFFTHKEGMDKFGVAITATERAFITICDKRAKSVGVALNWDLYRKVD